jgi:hypothetical protein
MTSQADSAGSIEDHDPGLDVLTVGRPHGERRIGKLSSERHGHRAKVVTHPSSRDGPREKNVAQARKSRRFNRVEKGKSID